MKLEDICMKIIKEFFVNVDTTAHTEKVHFVLGILTLAKKLEPHNKAIDILLSDTAEKIKEMNAKADFLEFFFRYLDDETDGKAETVKVFAVTLEAPDLNGCHRVIKIDYKSEFVEK